MIILTKLRGERFVLNCDLIETVEAKPDSTITLTNGRIYIVQESMEEIIQKTAEYRRECHPGFCG